MTLQLKTLVLRAKLFSRRLNRIKRRIGHAEFEWFPYPVMDNVRAIDGLLEGANRSLFKRVAGAAVADLGAADGDLSFFLESLGFEVDLVDLASANFNGLRAAHALSDALDSKVSIHNIDLDAGTELPRSRYGLVFLLGTLYHLKNPYLVLEQLAAKTDYLLLSTRIARYARNGGIDYQAESMAYLLDEDECNHDATNFWIFSEAGLHRLVKRCGWDILDYCSYGAVGDSTPQQSDRDERAWMLLQSRTKQG